MWYLLECITVNRNTLYRYINYIGIINVIIIIVETNFNFVLDRDDMTSRLFHFTRTRFLSLNSSLYLVHAI